VNRADPPGALGAVERAPLPPRPASIELAAALLIVTGATGLVTIAGAVVSGLTDPFWWVGVALNAGSVALGVATRVGRLWLVTLNYAAVLAFLDILGASTSPQALMIGITEIVVVVILLLRKPWFDAVAEARAGAGEDQPLTPPTASPPIR
jgi:hypothetical protein